MSKEKIKNIMATAWAEEAHDVASRCMHLVEAQLKDLDEAGYVVMEKDEVCHLNHSESYKNVVCGNQGTDALCVKCGQLLGDKDVVRQTTSSNEVTTEQNEGEKTQ